MTDKQQTVVDLLQAWFGGAGTTLIGAALGRFMLHVSEARKAKRKFFGPELVWELPIAIGMAIIGEGMAAYLSLGHPTSTGLVAALAYLGPRGAEVLFMKWFGKKTDP